MRHASFNFINDLVLEVTFGSQVPTEEAFEMYLAELLRIYKESNQGIIVIFNSEESKFVPSKLRKRQAQWMKDNEVIIREKCLMCVYVIPNLLIKFILEAIFLIQKSPVHYEIVKSTEKAKYLIDQLIPETSAA